ncbi:glutathione S-transferase alpha-3-like isoform X2 [Chionomys nivalis]|uniref:glutathione S-transferase alpha-3-like isoform X2 n=1 Tax=Chionomys nivalis TaxID=269649 RepID=UPI002599E128|nr:glutathione S-transferase alpha-3-like isoform X2 [Chionomys nivalis]
MIYNYKTKKHRDLTTAMATKPVLHYFHSRGRMESVRWLLAAAGVEFEEKFIKTQKDLKRLKNDGSLMFRQVPMVEIDGMKLVQTRAILNYIATKYNLYGKDMKERAMIDMYTEGTIDLNEMIIRYPFLPPGEKDASLAQIIQKARKCYFPAFEEGLRTRVSNLPTVKKFLQPGSQRKPFEDEKFVEELKKNFF